MLKQLKKPLFAALLVCASSSAFAVPIPLGLNISGSLTVDQIDAFDSVSNVETAIAGGASFPFNLGQGGSVGANFSEIGDGFDLDASISGNDQDGVSYDGFGNYDLFSLDLFMDNTTTNDYEITWALDYTLLADADGSDAFAETILTFQDLLTTLFSENHTSDVAIGDLVNGVDPGTFGAAQGASGSTSFVFNLAAGATNNDFSGAASLRGGVYDALSSFSADIDFSLRIAGIRDLTTTQPPNSVPEPFSLSLILMGLGLMFRKRFNA